MNEGLRVYNFDAGDSLMRNSDKEKNLYDNLVSNKFMLDENLDYFFYAPKYFLNPIIKFIVSGIELNLSPLYLIKNMDTSRFRLAYFLLFPVGFIARLYFKHVKKKFWF